MDGRRCCYGSLAAATGPSERRVGKGAQRRAHQTVSGSSNVPPSVAQDRRWSVFFKRLRSPTGRSAVSTAMLRKAYCPAIVQETRANYLDASVKRRGHGGSRPFPPYARFVTVFMTRPAAAITQD